METRVGFERSGGVDFGQVAAEDGMLGGWWGCDAVLEVWGVGTVSLGGRLWRRRGFWKVPPEP